MINNLLVLFILIQARAADLVNLPSGPIDPAPGVAIDQIAERIYLTLAALAFPLGFISIVYTAYVLISSQGNPDAIGKAKKNITYLFTGLFLIIFAIILVRVLINVFN